MWPFDSWLLNRSSTYGHTLTGNNNMEMYACSASQVRLACCHLETHSKVIRDKGGRSYVHPSPGPQHHTHAHTSKWHLPVNKEHTAVGHRLTVDGLCPLCISPLHWLWEQSSWAGQDAWRLPALTLPRPEPTPFNRDAKVAAGYGFF